MKTSDEETRHFCKHSSVQVLICPRSGGKCHCLVKIFEVEAIYTHHQKTVIVDAEAAQNRRKIVAFVGGLDVCNGRFDTPKHSLFRTLKTLQKDDFHNPNFIGGLDMCKGRFDTPKHHLFSTLMTIHKDDFHNLNFETTANDGPREPWHDLHSKIDGPTAYDVLTNFEERWRKASKHSRIWKHRSSSDDFYA